MAKINTIDIPVNIRITRIEIPGNDPDRFIMDLVKKFKTAKENK